MFKKLGKTWINRIACNSGRRDRKLKREKA